jgi:hypothetical protein
MLYKEPKVNHRCRKWLLKALENFQIFLGRSPEDPQTHPTL